MTTPDASVTTLQASLMAGGMQPGPIDGVLGPQTLRALCYLAGRAFIDLDAAGKLWAAMEGQQIVKPLRIIHFLANCGAESGWMLRAENLNYTAARLMEVWPSRFPTPPIAIAYAGNPPKLGEYVYGGRMGNVDHGDGYKYRGRGWPQLTGRDAYRTIGGMIGLDLEGNPDLMLTPDGCARASAAFWTWKGLEYFADMDDGTTVRQRWNGGLNGWPTVQAAITRLKQAWGMTA